MLQHPYPDDPSTMCITPSVLPPVIGLPLLEGRLSSKVVHRTIVLSPIEFNHHVVST
jgi:hypothetical protein